MSRQKILVIASWYPSASSPVSGIFIQDQAQALSKKYDVAVLAPCVVGWREILQGKIGAPSELKTEGKLLVCRKRVFAPLPHAPVLAYQRLLKLVEKDFIKLSTQWGKPDLIHAHVVLPGGWIAVQLGRRHGIPVVLTEHSGPFSMQLQTASQRRWVSETLAQADGLIAVSPALAQQIRAFQDEVAIHVIGNLIKTDFFTPAQNFEAESPGATTRFLSVGLLTWQKGISYLLQAAQQLLQRQITSFEIIIGGDGPERRRLESLAQNLGLDDHCRFIGLLTREQVKQQMQRCEVFIMPSLHETFCLVLGEAMACGKPVIATRSGGPEFVVTRETGVLVEPANSTALADAMQDFMASKLKFDSQRLRQSVVERFGEAAFLRQIGAVYEEIWSKNTPED